MYLAEFEFVVKQLLIAREKSCEYILMAGVLCIAYWKLIERYGGL